MTIEIFNKKPGDAKVVPLNANHTKDDFTAAAKALIDRTEDCLEYVIIVRDKNNVIRHEEGCQYQTLSPLLLMRLQHLINQNLTNMFVEQ